MTLTMNEENRRKIIQLTAVGWVKEGRYTDVAIL